MFLSGQGSGQFIMCNEPGHQQRSGMAMYLGRFIATAPSVSQYHVHVFYTQSIKPSQPLQVWSPCVLSKADPRPQHAWP